MKQRGRPRKIRQDNEDNSETLAPDPLPEREESPETSPQSQIVSFVERIEIQEDEKTIAQKTIIDIYAEAKEQGIATQFLREAIRLRKLNPSERATYEALRNQYMQTLGLKP